MQFNFSGTLKIIVLFITILPGLIKVSKCNTTSGSTLFTYQAKAADKQINVIDTTSANLTINNLIKDSIPIEKHYAENDSTKQTKSNLIGIKWKLIPYIIDNSTIVLTGLLLFIIVAVFLMQLNFYSRSIQILTKKQEKLIEILDNHDSKISSLTSEVEVLRQKNVVNQADIKQIERDVIKKFELENKLSESEVKLIYNPNATKWFTLKHSETGTLHLKNNPILPCQDAHYHHTLTNNMELSIVCDGAGSAKYSHIGSALLAHEILPEIIKAKISFDKWPASYEFTNEKDWKLFAYEIVRESYEKFKNHITKEYNTNTLEDFATTLILTIYNRKIALVLNIGDGRGGYLNQKGYFKPLFTPFKGPEANSTVFFTSPIFDEPNKYINTSIIRDDFISLFILSDGMQKASFNCSVMEKGYWFDPNIPSKNFFYPIITHIRQSPAGKLNDLQGMWEQLIKSGNEEISKETDDKTMILSYLY